MKTILIDDEPIALDLLALRLSSYKDIEIIGRYTNPMDALEDINKTRPDIIFLDIQMGQMNGLEFAEIISDRAADIKVVFTTAYSEYAVEAFEINAIDYLLKPVQEKRLKKTIERLRREIQEKNKVNVINNKLDISSFNKFQVSDKMDRSITWRTQKSKELFAYLCNRREKSTSKIFIIDNIFPDRDFEKSTTILHTTIYQLRRSLEMLNFSNGIIYKNDSYKLNIPITSDTDRFNKLIESKIYNYETVEKILEIYTGDFLQEEAYHWSIPQQQVYKDMLFNFLREFINCKLEKEIDSPYIKTCLDKIYEIDPYNEDVAMISIHYYGKSGRRSNLESFFNSYIEKLDQDMRLKPMNKTVELYKEYMKNI